VLVTDEVFHADGRRYAMADLALLHWVWGPTSAGRRVSLAVLGATAIVMAAVVMVSWPSVLALLAGALYVVAAPVGLVLSVKCWPTPVSLWAEYRGRLTLLYTSTDHTELFKLFRALRRASEHRMLES